MFKRAEPLTMSLLDNTVINDWFTPMKRALEKVRYFPNRFQALPMESFLLFAGLRQLHSIETLREQIQWLFHQQTTVTKTPVARSTWSDAMKNSHRRDILRETLRSLICDAQNQLLDRLSFIKNAKQRPIVAIDATYQKESSHFTRVEPKDGGDDNQKGHMLLTCYDLRHAIPIQVKTETRSVGEMRLLKEIEETTESPLYKNAIYVVDRAFIDGSYWDTRKLKHKATVITRMKSTLNYQLIGSRDFASERCNENVMADYVIELNCSSQQWRLIQWRSPEGIVYRYLTNDFTLEPGEIAFLYYRRWDEEKYFDNFKHDLGNAKAWGKSPVAIEQQALFGIMSYVLTMLFLQKHCKILELERGDQTQKLKHQKKIMTYLEAPSNNEEYQKVLAENDDAEEGDICIPLMYDAWRAYYSQLSKITRQIWRFFKNCYKEKSSDRLYERQLKPLLLGYL